MSKENKEEEDRLGKLFDGVNLPDEGEQPTPGSPEFLGGVVTDEDGLRDILSGKMPRELRDALSVALSRNGGGERKRVEVDRFKAKISHRKRFDEMGVLADEGHELLEKALETLKKLRRKHAAAWALIAEELDDERDMSYDRETGEIVIFEDE